jgi:hypothetical protein
VEGGKKEIRKQTVAKLPSCRASLAFVNILLNCSVRPGSQVFHICRVKTNDAFLPKKTKRNIVAGNYFCGFDSSRDDHTSVTLLHFDGGGASKSAE